MGTDLILTKNGEYVSDLGRAYHFTEFGSDELDIDYEKLDIKAKELLDNIIHEVEKVTHFVAGYAMANKSKEDDSILNNTYYATLMDDVVATVDYAVDELQNIGRKKLLSYMLEDEGVDTKLDI